MPSIEDLVRRTEVLFGSLAGRRFRVESRELLGRPDQYRAGFALRLADGMTICEVVYSDLEVTVRVAGTEVFGASSHPGFAGNMFSPEHLAEHLPKLAMQIEPLLGDPSRDVV